MEQLKFYSRIMIMCFCHAFSKVGFNFVVLFGSHFCLIAQIQRLSGVDSDFAPFVQHAGVPFILICIMEELCIS